MDINMVQVQVLNGVPSMNIYGQDSMTDGFNFKDINRKGIYGYWDHSGLYYYALHAPI